MIEKLAMHLTFFLCKYLTKKHKTELLMIDGTEKSSGRKLIYSEKQNITKGLNIVLKPENIMKVMKGGSDV